MKQDKTFSLVMTGLMMCLVIVATMLIRIPVPATGGYVHLGDTMVFLSVIILGRRNGTIAAGIGSALADVFASYVDYAPWTLVVKGLMAFLMGTVLIYMDKKGTLQEHIGQGKLSVLQVLAMTAGGAEMVLGYYIAECFRSGSMIVPLAAIPPNILQFVVGAILATALAAALYRTPARKYFYFR